MSVDTIPKNTAGNDEIRAACSLIFGTLRARFKNRMKSLRLSRQTNKNSQLKFKPEITTREVTSPASIPAVALPVIIFETIEPIKPTHRQTVRRRSVSYTGAPLCDHSRKTAAVRTAASQKSHWSLGKPRRLGRVARQNCSPHEIQSKDYSRLQQRPGANTVEIELPGASVGSKSKTLPEFQSKLSWHRPGCKTRRLSTEKFRRSGMQRLPMATSATYGCYQ